MTNKFEPYIGPRPFECNSADQNRFFGRDDEARELLSRITAHSAVLLYAQSGAGKTSLINARVIPRLKEAGFEVLPPASIRNPATTGDLINQASNIYAF